MNYYTLTTEDVGTKLLAAFGKLWPVNGFLGRILPGDVGKRVYKRAGILQVENDEQYGARMAAVARPGFDDDLSEPHHGPGCIERMNWDEDVAPNTGWKLVAEFRTAWAKLQPQIELHAVHFAGDAVLAAHHDTCIECHNDDQRPRCPLRMALVEAMEGGQS